MPEISLKFYRYHPLTFYDVNQILIFTSLNHICLCL